ncbi:MAG: FecR domain-containing protein [Pseudomonadota bacterium]
MRTVFKSLGSLAALIALPLSAQEIGVVASSEPTLRGTPPGAAERALKLGTDVVFNEAVEASDSGRGQLLFRDQSTLTLAPNSRIVLDRFVYDPDQSAGEIGLSLTRGVLRFIGGRAADAQEATITTPTATIGIRGSSAFVQFLNGRTTAVFIAGEQLCIVIDEERTCTTRRGGVLTDEGYVGSIGAEDLAALLRALDGVPGQGGGGPGATGLQDQANPDQQPISTKGEELDIGLFDALFGTDLDRSLLGPGTPQSSGGSPMMDPDPDPEPEFEPEFELETPGERLDIRDGDELR